MKDELYYESGSDWIEGKLRQQQYWRIYRQRSHSRKFRQQSIFRP